MDFDLVQFKFYSVIEILQHIRSAHLCSIFTENLALLLRWYAIVDKCVFPANQGEKKKHDEKKENRSGSVCNVSIQFVYVLVPVNVVLHSHTLENMQIILCLMPDKMPSRVPTMIAETNQENQKQQRTVENFTPLNSIIMAWQDVKHCFWIWRIYSAASRIHSNAILPPRIRFAFSGCCSSSNNKTESFMWEYFHGENVVWVRKFSSVIYQKHIFKYEKTIVEIVSFSLQQSFTQIASTPETFDSAMDYLKHIERQSICCFSCRMPSHRWFRTRHTHTPVFKTSEKMRLSRLHWNRCFPSPTRKISHFRNVWVFVCVTRIWMCFKFVDKKRRFRQSRPEVDFACGVCNLTKRHGKTGGQMECDGKVHFSMEFQVIVDAFLKSSTFQTSINFNVIPLHTFSINVETMNRRRTL